MRTSWARVAVLLSAGIAAAYQVGKVPPSVTTLEAHLGIGALTASWVISLFAVIGACAGVAFGQFADRIGHRRAVIGGLACIALASAAGAQCTSVGPLLVTRVFEGFGFFAIAVGMPPVIAAVTRPEDRRLALAIWSSYMPLGIAIALVTAPPILAAGGWPLMWQVGAGVAAVAAGAIALVAPAPPERHAPQPLLAGIRAVAGARSPLAAGVTFAAYAGSYFAITGFLPTIIMATGTGVATAGPLSAAIAVLNGCGNVLAGVAARHFSRFAILVTGFVLVAAGGAIFYLTGIPLPVRLVAVAAGMCAAGMIPGTITGSIITLSPSPQLIGTTQGLVQQLSSVGQLIGPPLIAAVGAERGGPAGAFVLGGLATIGIIAASALRRSAPH
jgi:MFS family permease